MAGCRAKSREACSDSDSDSVCNDMSHACESKRSAWRSRHATHWLTVAAILDSIADHDDGVEGGDTRTEPSVTAGVLTALLCFTCACDHRPPPAGRASG